MMMPNPPPELTNYAANAYNAKDGNFLSKPVFALTYNRNKTIGWGPLAGDKRNIPDQISASVVTNYYSVQSSLLLESKSDYDRTFSVSVDAEYSGVTYSGSAQSSLLYHGNLFSSISSSYALNFYLQSVLSFERIEADISSLDSNFIAALTSLPTDISIADNQQNYFDFFDSYGTHYTSLATMGGTIVMETKIEDSLFESFSSLEISNAISAGYSGIVNSGKLNVDTAYSSSEFLSDHRNSVQITLHVMGGLYASGEPISSWFSSIYNTPRLLLDVPRQPGSRLTKLAAISRLVSIADGDPKIAANIESLIPIYLMQDYYKDSLLTSPKDISFSQVFDTRAGDGFVISTIQSTANGNRGYVQAFDSTDENPITIRATASQHYYTGRDHQIPSASLTMPTPMGTYYKGNKTATSGNPYSRLLHVGFGNTVEKGMGAWQEINLGADLTAATDGFVVAYVDYNQVNGARGYIHGKQKLLGTEYTIVAGSSQHYFTGSDTIVPTNSFCMPVRNGTSYRVDFTQTSGNPIAKAFFVPLSYPLVFFQELQSRAENSVFEAQTDGFLVAYLYMQSNGDRGYVDLYSYPDPTVLKELGKIASASIHEYSGSDTHVPYNTATIPVSKNDYYTANFTKTAGDTGIRLSWMPLGIQKKP